MCAEKSREVMPECGNRYIASKRMSRMRLCVRGTYMAIETIWCRVAYAHLEENSFFRHEHSFYELHYVLNGVQRVGTDTGEPLLLHEGDLLCIAPHTPHFSQHADKETEKFVCGFSLTTDNDWVREAVRILSCGKVYHLSVQLCSYVHLMLSAAETTAPHAETTVSRLLEGFFLELFEELLPESSFVPERLVQNAQTVPESDIRIAEVHRFIRDNVPYGINSYDVAAHMNISVRHLNRLVFQYEGCTIGKLLRARKTELIMELLHDPSLTLRMIAERTGFSSEYALGKYFKRTEGMSIGLYRRSLEK